MADGRDRAVAGVDDGVGRQRPEHAFDAGFQRLEAAAGEVGAADAAAEEHVAAEHRERLHLANQIDDVARRVAGNVEHFELDARDRERVAFLHEPVGGRAGHVEARTRRSCSRPGP